MKYEQKWAIASFFDDLDDGYTFTGGDTPLHATLASVFAIDLSGEEIADIIRVSVDGVNSFTVTVGADDLWGDIEVSLLKKSKEFSRLICSVQQALLAQGSIFNESQYLLDGFKPHVTHQGVGRLHTGDQQLISKLSLVDMFPDSDGLKRRVVSTVNLA